MKFEKIDNGNIIAKYRNKMYSVPMIDTQTIRYRLAYHLAVTNKTELDNEIAKVLIVANNELGFVFGQDYLDVLLVFQEAFLIKEPITTEVKKNK